MLDRLKQDLTSALRSLLRERGVTTIAIASLAVSIAANTTIFSLVEAVEFPRLLYPDASRIVFLESRNNARGLAEMPVSAPDAIDIAAASRTLAVASLAADQTSILREGTLSRRVSGRRVTPAFFDVMRVPPSAGRVLNEGDGPGSLVLSDRLWRSQFTADASVVGRGLRLDGGIVTVVGVMPPGFDSDVDFWVPLSSGVSGFRRDDRQFMVFARLAPSVSVDAATAELADLSTRLAAEHPSTNKDWVTFPTRITRLHGRDSRRAFVLLQAAVGILLLIACANIANILLARGTRRRHEIAVRVSLGASRARMLGTLLTESLLLAIAGGAIGILLAMWGIRLARATMSFPSSIDPALNGVVLAFTAALSMLTGILCGIVPAARGSRIEPSLVLREERPGDSGASRGRLRAALVGAQVACALVLVTCGALMLRTLENRHRIDLGFDPRAAIRADLALAGDRYQTPAVVRRTVDQLIDGLSNGPDVVAAGAITWALPTSAGAQRSLTRPDQRDAALAPSIRRGVEAVTPTYFDAIGAPLRRGRRFAALDREGSAPVAIVNEELVRHLWPDRDPLGQPLRLGSPTEAAPIVTVVGVVATIRRSAMHDTPVARVYLPFAQHPNSTLSLVVRGRGDLATIGRELQAAVQAIDPMLLVEQVRTVEADVAQFIAPIRLITTLLALFGITGLLLAALGIFGTMSYTVSQRSRELAIRAALGADTRTILRLVFASVVRLTTVGVIAGVGLASIATRALTAFLYGVSALDPLTFAMVIAFLTFVAISAAYGPARMAVKADPMTILRR